MYCMYICAYVYMYVYSARSMSMYIYILCICLYMYLLGMYCRYRSIIYPYLSYYYRYTWKHLAGVLICLSGLACIVLNDYLNFSGDDSASASSANPLIGDILCLLGAVLYASSNVLQEKLGMCVYVCMYV
jgi:drug/metabolite transporter (DMT)-like permease